MAAATGDETVGAARGAEAAPGRRLRTLEEVGLGVDIVEIERMKKILARTPSFRKKVFSEEEQAYCDGKGVPEIHYAMRFAAKEAVLKALGTGFSEGIGARDVEVVRNAKGKPTVALHGRAKEVAADLGVVELPLSLSYTHTEAVACAMAITAESVKAAEKRVDPMEELAKQFKEARAMLDEMDAKPKGPSEGPASEPPFPSEPTPGDSASGDPASDEPPADGTVSDESVRIP